MTINISLSNNFQVSTKQWFLTLALPNGEKSLHCFWLRKAFTKSTDQTFLHAVKRALLF